MEFYSLRLESDPKVIGVRNGIYQVELIEKMYDKETLSCFEDYFWGKSSMYVFGDSLPSFDIEFNFKKLRLAKETSFLRFSPYLNNCHFLMNEDIQSVFEKFNIQPYILYESKIYDSSKSNPIDRYKMFFSFLQDWDVIDFKNTVFTSGGYGSIPLTEHIFKDYVELNNFNSHSRITDLKTLALSNKFDSTLDLVCTRLGGVLISERLKSTLEDINANGILFKKDFEVMYPQSGQRL